MYPESILACSQLLVNLLGRKVRKYLNHSNPSLISYGGFK